MAIHTYSSNKKPSIKYSSVKHDLTSFELGYIGQANDAHRQKSSSNLLSTSEFVYAVGRIWSSLNQPNDVLRPVENRPHNNDNMVCHSKDSTEASPSTNTRYFSIDFKSYASFPLTINSRSKHPKVTEKMLLSESVVGHNRSSSFWSPVQYGSTGELTDPWCAIGPANLGNAYDFGRTYECICQNPLYSLKEMLNFTKVKYTKPSERNSQENVTPVESNSSAYRTCKDDLLVKSVKLKDPLSSESSMVASVHCSNSSLHTAYSLGTVAILETQIISEPSISSIYSDYHLRHLDSVDSPVGVAQQLSVIDSTVNEMSEVSHHDDGIMHESEKAKHHKSLLEVKTTLQSRLPMHKKLFNISADQKHAIAGALAGTFVSLSLHPVDTVKTVIQARSKDEKSFRQIFGSIISERGVTGLYRGIASNIASSAPISAVYTFTYESVKRALLPLLPKEYHSVAHCAAGGCASIATSFIFTPSERIKQQLQVGSHYQNCWTALIGILGKGGLPSLYAGWGAVLCRNIPHSIIKFYTYESLKQKMLSLSQSNAQSSSQTLLCGGVAASTAALFTTPFDVVKTRLQTQIPGSSKQCDGVLQGLRQISKHEGFRGLYRGLTPRLAMYMSQGAIFFASYEFFKSLFSFEVSQVSMKVTDEREKVDDMSVTA